MQEKPCLEHLHLQEVRDYPKIYNHQMFQLSSGLPTRKAMRTNLWWPPDVRGAAAHKHGQLTKLRTHADGDLHHIDWGLMFTESVCSTGNTESARLEPHYHQTWLLTPSLLIQAKLPSPKRLSCVLRVTWLHLHPAKLYSC